MNVKDIFALRKQGKIEEAYEAIRPIYREHKGRFTTLCMFWVASDVFKLRLEQKRIEEALKGDEALSKGQQAVLDCIKANEGIKVPKLSELTNIPSKSIERHIKVLIERRLIEHRGSKKTGGYHALK